MLRARQITSIYKLMGAGLFIMIVAVAGTYLIKLSSAATVIYVDISSRGGQCDDTAAGTALNAPLCSLNRAVQIAPNGSRIEVRRGVYPTLHATRAATSLITIAPYAGDKTAPGDRPVVIKAKDPSLEAFQPGREADKYAVWLDAAPAGTATNLRLEGMVIDGITYIEGNNNQMAGNEHTPYGYYLYGANNIVDGNYIHDLTIKNPSPNPGDGDCTTYKDNNAVDKLTGRDPWCGYAFRAGGSGNVIRNNLIRKVPADAFQLYNSTDILIENNDISYVDPFVDLDEHSDSIQVIGKNSGVTIKGNYLHGGSADARDKVRGPLIQTRVRTVNGQKVIETPQNVRFENNVGYQLSSFLIDVAAADGIDISNNTCGNSRGVEGCGSVGVRVSREALNVRFRNNIVDRVSLYAGAQLAVNTNNFVRYTAPLSSSYVAYPVGSAPVTVLPALVPGDSYLRLAAGSSAINAGTSSGAPATDRECKSRLGAVDVGAHEYGGSGSCVSLPPPSSPAPPTSPTPEPPPPSPVGSLRLTGISENQTIVGQAPIGAEVANLNVAKVEFVMDGVALRSEVTAPYCLAGDAGGPCKGWNSTIAGNGLHVFSARAYDAAGTVIAAAPVVSVLINNPVPDSQAPSRPGGLRASSPDPATVSLTWAAAADNIGVSGYNIYRDEATTPTASISAGTAFNDTGLRPGTSYSYRVEAYDATGNRSAQSLPVLVRTPELPDLAAPSVPADLKAGAVTRSSIMISWSPSTDSGGSGLAGYHIYRDGSRLVSTDVSKYTDISLIAGSSFTYSVAAYDNAGNVSTQSAPIKVTTPADSAGRTGDIDGDGKINIRDINLFISRWRKTDGDSLSAADFNRDGKIDIRDLNILIAGYGK